MSNKKIIQEFTDVISPLEFFNHFLEMERVYIQDCLKDDKISTQHILDTLVYNTSLKTMLFQLER